MPWAAVTAGAVWLLVAASAMHWGLRLGVRGAAAPSQAETVGVGQALQGDALRLFARAPVQAAAVPSPARDRFRVLGVAAREGGGWVLMSVDGKTPRVYRSGASVDGRWQVLSVAQRRIEIGPAEGPAAVSLDLPALPAAATGQRPPVQMNNDAAAPPLAVPPPPAAETLTPDAAVAR